MVRVYGCGGCGRLRGLVMVMMVHGRGRSGRVVMIVAHCRGVWVQGRGRRVVVTRAGAVAAHHTGQRQASASASATATTDAASNSATQATNYRTLLLLGLGRQLPVPCLYAFFFHRQRPVNVVQFIVETASVANGFAVLVSPPQRRGGRFAIRTARPGSAGSRLQGQTSLGLNQRPVLPVHFIVEATRITQVVSGAVSPPQWSRRGSAVHALSSFGAGPRLISGRRGRGVFHGVGAGRMARGRGVFGGRENGGSDGRVVVMVVVIGIMGV